MDKYQPNNLTARISRVIANESGANDLEPLRRSIDRLCERVERLELEGLRAPPLESSVHPSRDTFHIGEALGDRVFGSSNDKICTFEPHERPCDHCSMCTARGF